MGPRGSRPPASSLRLRRWPIRQEPFSGFAKAKTLKPKRPRQPRFRPLLLSKLLGKNAIRPPRTTFPVPDIDFAKLAIPAHDPNGKPIDPQPPDPETLESYAPPESGGAHASKPHWDMAEELAWRHDGKARGRWDGEHWAWLARVGARWWIQAPPQPESDEPVAALVRHGDHWWWQARGAWFLLHDGRPWGYRFFADLSEEGLIDPETGARMAYSADGSRVAVIIPGGGAVLYDAYTGEVIGRWSEEQMPKPPRPRAPVELPALP